MFSETSATLLIILMVANLGLLGWILRRLRSRAENDSGFSVSLTGRFDGIDRNAEALRRELVQMDQALRAEIARGSRDGLASAFDKVQQGTRAQAEQLGAFGRQLADGLSGVQQAMTAQQEQLRGVVESKLSEIRSGNEAKLEEMRKTVDEQLQSALERRLTESFQRVTQQFAEVQQAIGQVQSVTGQIGDLTRLFSNVKARGGWGEAHLQSLLDDVLPPGSYQTNFRVDDDSGEVVEFALRMPRQDKWLAIDAKFPAEDYDRLVQAAEAGDRDQEAGARRALERRLRDEAKRIAGKYVNRSKTVEFAVMYLPSEGLYLEAYRIPGLLEAVRREHKVMVLAPSSAPGFLYCMRVGHLTLALEQKAGVIGELLSAVKAEWANLGKSLDTLARRAETLTNGIRDTQLRTRVVGRKLKTVEALDFEQAEKVLGLSEEVLLIETQTEDAEEDDIPVLTPGREAAD